MFGFLNLEKPGGVTSRDVVNRVQRLVRPNKVGHAGTLDPLATGVLVVAVGPATRLVEYVQQARKQYRGEFLLGRESDTEDTEGEVIELTDAPRPAPRDVEAALPKFLGRIEQRPPAYSALKVGGRRAYNLAREGKTVALAPRMVEIHELRLVDYDYPRLTLEITCGSGTYIRSLGRDIAQALGTAAVLSALVRTRIGPFDLADACDAETLTRSLIEARLCPATFALADLPHVTLADDDLARIANGQTVKLDARSEVGAHRETEERLEVAALDQQGNLRALLVPRGAEWGPLRNFPAVS